LTAAQVDSQVEDQVNDQTDSQDYNPVAANAIRVQQMSTEERNGAINEIIAYHGRNYYTSLPPDVQEIVLINMVYFRKVKSNHIDDHRITMGGKSYTGGRRPWYHQMSASGCTIAAPNTILEDFYEWLNANNPENVLLFKVRGVNITLTKNQLKELAPKYLTHAPASRQFSMDIRLEKFLRIIGDLENIKAALVKCVRPDFWTNVIIWLEGLAIAKQEFGIGSWEGATDEQKHSMRLAALASPGFASQGLSAAIHKNFETAASLISMSETAHSVEAITKMMDHISNPVTYQTPQVAQAVTALQAHSVNSPYAITLVWQTLDDFDLDVVLPNYTRISLNNLQSDNFKLNFDANCNCGPSSTKTPVECISYTGKGIPPSGVYKVYVNLYRRYNQYATAPIDFTIIVMINGQSTEYKHSWAGSHTKSISGGRLYESIRIDASQFSAPSLEISDSKARSIEANSPRFVSAFGKNPKAQIMTLDEIRQSDFVEILWKHSPECGGGGRSAGGGGRSLVNSILGRTKTTLAERQAAAAAAANPSIENLIRGLSSGDHITMNMCSGLPTYITGVMYDQPSIEGVAPRGKMTFNTLHHNNVIHKPDASLGTTERLNPDWFSHHMGYYDRPKVIAIIKHEEKYFLILQGAKIPDADVLSITGGFYPTDLSGELHACRAEYAIFNAVRPDCHNEGIPLIGVWVWETMSIEVNGKKMILSL